MKWREYEREKRHQIACDARFDRNRNLLAGGMSNQQTNGQTERAGSNDRISSNGTATVGSTDTGTDTGTGTGTDTDTGTGTDPYRPWTKSHTDRGSRIFT
jgi:hypothetical protein